MKFSLVTFLASVNLGACEIMISRGASSVEKKEIIAFIEASILK